MQCSPSQGVICPPNCMLACKVPVEWWRAVDPADPDPWHVAYAVATGLGRRKPPIPRGELRGALRWYAQVWDRRTVADGLRHAARLPVPHGLPDCRTLLEALAVAWQREVTA